MRPISFHKTLSILPSASLMARVCSSAFGNQQYPQVRPTSENIIRSGLIPSSCQNLHHRELFEEDAVFFYSRVTLVSR